MKSVMIAPRKYVQGRGVLGEIGPYVKAISRRPLVLWDAQVRAIVGDTVRQSFAGAELEFLDAEFSGESTREEGERIAQMMRDRRADCCIGIGGGKTLDIAKAAGIYSEAAIVTVPTIASNDSPTSAASVWYDAEGNCTGFDCWPRNPDIVLVDTQVIASGPVRAFVAGMGDALATWYEADAAYKTRATNLGGGKATFAAMAIARLCGDTLMEYGLEAKRAVEMHVVTPAVERVVEANVLLSGLGFESGGLATAHAIANALPSFPECKQFMHGEKVGFGVVSQLCLDDETDVDEMHHVVDFEIAVGLPVCFADLKLEGVTRDRLKMIGDICAAPGSLCESHAFKVTSEAVVDAMIAADALGRERKQAVGCCDCG